MILYSCLCFSALGCPSLVPQSTQPFTMPAAKVCLGTRDLPTCVYPVFDGQTMHLGHFGWVRSRSKTTRSRSRCTHLLYIVHYRTGSTDCTMVDCRRAVSERLRVAQQERVGRSAVVCLAMRSSNSLALSLLPCVFGSHCSSLRAWYEAGECVELCELPDPGLQRSLRAFLEGDLLHGSDDEVRRTPFPP